MTGVWARSVTGADIAHCGNQGPSLISQGGRYPKIGASFPDRGYAGMTALVQVFGRRDDEAIHAHLRPASEKRQGTKSREVGSGGAAGAMGILPRARAPEGWSGAVAGYGVPPSMDAGFRVNHRSAPGAARAA